MKYKILALTVASVIGVPLIVLSSDKTGIDNYLSSKKESAFIELSDKNSNNEITFTKGAMFAINLGSISNVSKTENDDEEIDDDDDYDDDSSAASVDYDDEEEDSSSKGGGFRDIKSALDNKNKYLPESKTEYHIHKNAPARSVTNKLDPQGLITEYITYFYGDEIEMKHTVSFLANGNINVNGNIKANFQTNTPAKSWSNSRKVNGQTIMDFYYYNGKIKATFTFTPLGNGSTNVNYNTTVVDPNI